MHADFDLRKMLSLTLMNSSFFLDDSLRTPCLCFAMKLIDSLFKGFAENTMPMTPMTLRNLLHPDWQSFKKSKQLFLPTPSTNNRLALFPPPLYSAYFGRIFQKFFKLERSYCPRDLIREKKCSSVGTGDGTQPPHEQRGFTQTERSPADDQRLLTQEAHRWLHLFICSPGSKPCAYIEKPIILSEPRDAFNHPSSWNFCLYCCNFWFAKKTPFFSFIFSWFWAFAIFVVLFLWCSTQTSASNSFSNDTQ